MKKKENITLFTEPIANYYFNKKKLKIILYVVNHVSLGTDKSFITFYAKLTINPFTHFIIDFEIKFYFLNTKGQ